MSKPYVVRFGFDYGGPESGPIMQGGWDIVYADSPDEACRIWESDNISDEDREYGPAYEGCFAKLATDQEVAEWQEETRKADEEYQWLLEQGWLDPDPELLTPDSVESANRLLYPYVLVGEFEDGYRKEQEGEDIGDCLYRLTQLEDKHGDLTWYGGLNDEDYVDGEYVGQDRILSSEAVEETETEEYDEWSPYSGGRYRVSDDNYNLRLTNDPKAAIKFWFMLGQKSPGMTDIMCPTRKDAIELCKAATPEYLTKLKQQYKCPYKLDFLIDTAAEQVESGCKYFYENSYGYGDAVEPFSVG